MLDHVQTCEQHNVFYKYSRIDFVFRCSNSEVRHKSGFGTSVQEPGDGDVCRVKLMIKQGI